MLDCGRRMWVVGCGIIFFSLVVSGCPTTPGESGGRDGTSVRKANRSLTELVNELGRAKAANDESQISDVSLRLRTLGETTEGSAQVEPDPLNRIALYRIATTAAWQADDERITQYANPGTTLCEAHSERAPRDCSMLAVLPVFAAAGQTTDRLNAVQRMPRGSEDERAQVLSEAQIVLGEFADELALVFESRPQIAASPADPAVLDAIDSNIEGLLCETVEIKTFGVVATVSDSISDTLCLIGRLKERAKSAGLTNDEINCLERGATIDACD